MTYRIMVSEVCDPVQTLYHGVRSAWQICRWQTSGPLFQQELIPGFQQGFHCVILDLKGLPSHLFWRIVTFNNCKSYCLDSSWTLTFSHQVNLFVSFFPHWGGKIHEQEVKLGKKLSKLSFFMETLVRGTQATQAKDTQVMLTQTKRQRNFELFNPSQA